MIEIQTPGLLTVQVSGSFWKEDSPPAVERTGTESSWVRGSGGIGVEERRLSSAGSQLPHIRMWKLLKTQNKQMWGTSRTD